MVTQTYNIVVSGTKYDNEIKFIKTTRQPSSKLKLKYIIIKIIDFKINKIFTTIIFENHNKDIFDCINKEISDKAYIILNENDEDILLTHLTIKGGHFQIKPEEMSFNQKVNLHHYGGEAPW